ncbi:MAG: hypothetical protein WCF33_05305 [Pseudonocardiaceae bacterium]
MSVFMAGVVVMLVPGLVTGWVLAGVLGWVMRRHDYCRHRVPAPVMVRVVGERVSPAVVPTVITVHVHPDAALAQRWSSARVVEGRVLDFPTGDGDRRFTHQETRMTRRGYRAAR